MMESLSKEQRAVGSRKFQAALQAYYRSGASVDRREFLRGMLTTGAMAGVGLGAIYYGYEAVTDPVRVAVIGTGNQGGALIGACNPRYLQVKAICDIRPFSLHRAFHGDWSGPQSQLHRPGLLDVYSYDSLKVAKNEIAVYDHNNGGIQACLQDPHIEAVVIALPQWLHGPVVAQAIKRGLHVLVEPLIAHNVAQCKVIARLASERTDARGQPLRLAIAHQRRYNLQYTNAMHLVQAGTVGQVTHLRMRRDLNGGPGNDPWKGPMPGGEIDPDGKRVDEIASELRKREHQLTEAGDPDRMEQLQHEIACFKAWDSDQSIDLSRSAYRSFSIGDRVFGAEEELHRWRLFRRTGAGLMGEFGSHAVDTASMVLDALPGQRKQSYPLNVHAVGGRHLMPPDRDAEDHVYCIFQFPGPEYSPQYDVGYRDPIFGYPVDGVHAYDPKTNPDHKVVVTFSSTYTNGPAGPEDVIVGTKGTLILNQEKDGFLFQNQLPSKGGVTDQQKIRETKLLGDQAQQPSLDLPLGVGVNESDIGFGFREEMEHWAYCIRNPGIENQPRGTLRQALANAVITYGTNLALRQVAMGKSGYLEFKNEWFDPNNDATPDQSSVPDQSKALLKPITK